MKFVYDKHFFITIFVLVILPVILIISSTISSIYLGAINEFIISNIDNLRSLGISEDFIRNILDQVQFFPVVVTHIEYVTFTIMIIIYPLYSIIFSGKLFSKRDSKSVIKEYEVIKKIILVLFPIFVLAAVFYIGQQTPIQPYLQGFVNIVNNLILIKLFLIIMGAAFFIVGAALLRLVFMSVNKNYKFYLARMYLRGISEEEGNEVTKMAYLIQGLTFYNQYVRRRLGLQINNLQVMYSKIISDTGINRNFLMTSVHSAFEDSDELEVIRCLAKLIKVTDPERFLIKEPRSKKLEILGGEVGTLLSIIIAIIGIIVTIRQT